MDRRKHDIDGALVKRFVIGGEEQAFNVLWKKYRKALWMVVFRIVRDATETDDVMQEVAICIFEKAHTWRQESAFSSWMYRVASNCALMYLRSNKSKIQAVDLKALRHGNISHRVTLGSGGEHGQYDRVIQSIPANTADPDSTIAAKDELRILQRALTKMPRRWRLYTELTTVWGYTAPEISNADNIRLPAVKSLINRGRKEWRRRIAIHRNMRRWNAFKKAGNI